jgi:anti-anti-sigma factor
LTGELDLSSIGVLQEALDPLLEGKPPRLVFDLGALRFMDSSGLAEVLRTATATSVELRNPSKIVRRVIELTGVSGILPIQP